MQQSKKEARYMLKAMQEMVDSQGRVINTYMGATMHHHNVVYLDC